MKIVCAESVLYGREAFETIGDVDVLPDTEISSGDLVGADALVTRSKTKIDGELVGNTGLEFAGTATAGFDHIAAESLAEMGVHWTAAPGCNADSVAEYVVAALLELACGFNFELADLKIAIVGVGQVGRRMSDRAVGLQMQPLLNDPPRAVKEQNEELRPLAEILPQADVVTLHTPLTDGGRHPTRHLADADFFQILKPGAVFINASRGEVVEEESLMRALKSGHVVHAVLDVWEGEPHCRRELLEMVDIATPHIAGYSYDGKLRGTAMIYAAVCAHFGIQPRWDSSRLLPPSPTPSALFEPGSDEQSALRELVASIYDIRRDDKAMRPSPLPGPQEHARLFNLLRKNYPIRREFAGTRIKLPSGNPELSRRLTALGFAQA